MYRKTSQNHKNSGLIKTLAILLTLIQNVCTQQQPNLLINGDFSTDSLNGSMYNYFSSHITGWNCTHICQINDCLKMNQYWIPQGSYAANCTGNVIDTISNTLENITQNIVLEYDYYNLSLSYYYPRLNAGIKTFQVYFNEENIFSLTPNVSSYYIPQYFQKRVQGIDGVNTLRITTKKDPLVVDNDGFFVNNVKLKKMANSLKLLVNSTLLSEFALIITKIPGSRVIFADFMGFFVNFDRLQFYYFHNRNYSQYSTFLLTDINIANQLKGVFFQNVLQLMKLDISAKLESFFSSIDYKYNYTPKIIFQRDQSGKGFISNCYPFFVYTVPGTLVAYLLLYVLFILVRGRPASRLIREYSFFGILIYMLFEGNIESLTYYSIGEMTLFFSANFHHRLINVFIIFFQLIATIVAFGSVLFFKFHYRRFIFYLISDKRNNGLGLLCQTVDNGVICLLFGIVHQVVFFKPQLQLFILLSIECMWMTFKMCLIFNKAYKKKFAQFIMFTAGLVRIGFIITFYFYEDDVQMRSLINDDIHRTLLITTLLLWLQELIISFAQFFVSIPKFFAKLGLLELKRKYHQQKNQKIILLHDRMPIVSRNTIRNVKIDRDKFNILKNLHPSPMLKLPKKQSRFKAKKMSITKLQSIQQGFK